MRAGESPLGPDPRLAVTLAYAAWWVSGSLVWLVERDRPAIRFHALQSILTFGSATLLWAALWAGSFAVLVVSATGFFVLQRLAQFVLIATALVWVYCLWKAVRREDLRLPVVAPRVDRLTRGEPRSEEGSDELGK